MKTVVRTMRPNSSVNVLENVIQIWVDQKPVAEIEVMKGIKIDAIHKGKEIPHYVLLENTRLQVRFGDDDEFEAT